MKYTVDATLIITLEQVEITLAESASGEQAMIDALMQKLQKQLVLLDFKGARSGDEGLITSIECDSLDNWNAN
ncbi:MAG: hypothetical protein GY906_24240 [bacterium]|nr:hypothetical protein [bacterium]